MMDFDLCPEIGPVNVERPEKAISLRTWLLKNTKNEICIYSVYVYYFTAPGEWCLMVWYLDNERRLLRIKDSIEKWACDNSGQYIHGKTLNSLTKAEKDELYEDAIRA